MIPMGVPDPDAPVIMTKIIPFEQQQAQKSLEPKKEEKKETKTKESVKKDE